MSTSAHFQFSLVCSLSLLSTTKRYLISPQHNKRLNDVLGLAHLRSRPGHVTSPERLSASRMTINSLGLFLPNHHPGPVHFGLGFFSPTLNKAHGIYCIVWAVKPEPEFPATTKLSRLSFAGDVGSAGRGAGIVWQTPANPPQAHDYIFRNGGSTRPPLPSASPRYTVWTLPSLPKQLTIDGLALADRRYVRTYYFDFISHVTSGLLIPFPLMYYLGFRGWVHQVLWCWITFSDKGNFHKFQQNVLS
jgi:hypothetical protein